jgi:hypothetical protein
MIITERSITEEKVSTMKHLLGKASELGRSVGTTAESMLQTGMPIMMEAGVAITLLGKVAGKAIER